VIDQPLPKLTAQTTILSIDVESNGLHGEAFAVGAVLMKLDGTVLEEFLARCPITGELDPWVKERVLPAMADVKENYQDTKELRTAFWKWYKPIKERADYVITDNGYPVEARFLIACQDDDLNERYWDHPFPLLDPASMLMQIGVKPLAIRYEFVADRLGNQSVLQHNPRFDAWVSALTVIKALELSGQLKKKE